MNVLLEEMRSRHVLDDLAVGFALCHIHFRECFFLFDQSSD